MHTVKDIFSSYNLSDIDVAKLSNEAKQHSIDCGKKGLSEELDRKLEDTIWDLFYEISEYHWNSKLPSIQKITLGFELFETFPDYYHFLVPYYHAIRDGEIVDQNEKTIIWRQFMHYLASENYYADPVGYVLWVEFFEDGSTVRETWQGLLDNYTDGRSVLRLLEQSGPVPFDLKEALYNELLADTKNHDAIFKSLLYSAFDVYGQIDKKKASDILWRLNINTGTDMYRMLKEKLR